MTTSSLAMPISALICSEVTCPNYRLLEPRTPPSHWLILHVQPLNCTSPLLSNILLYMKCWGFALLCLFSVFWMHAWQWGRYSQSSDISYKMYFFVLRTYTFLAWFSFMYPNISYDCECRLYSIYYLVKLIFIFHSTVCRFGLDFYFSRANPLSRFSRHNPRVSCAVEGKMKRARAVSAAETSFSKIPRKCFLFYFLLYSFIPCTGKKELRNISLSYKVEKKRRKKILIIFKFSRNF